MSGLRGLPPVRVESLYEPGTPRDASWRPSRGEAQCCRRRHETDAGGGQADPVGELPPCCRLMAAATFGRRKLRKSSPLYRAPGSSANLCLESAPLSLKRARDNSPIV